MYAYTCVHVCMYVCTLMQNDLDRQLGSFCERVTLLTVTGCKTYLCLFASFSFWGSLHGPRSQTAFLVLANQNHAAICNCGACKPQLSKCNAGLFVSGLLSPRSAGDLTCPISKTHTMIPNPRWVQEESSMPRWTTTCTLNRSQQ